MWYSILSNLNLNALEMIVTLTKLYRLIYITYKLNCILQQLLVYTAFITLYMLDKPAYTTFLISLFIVPQRGWIK